MIGVLGWVLTAQADTLVEFRRDTAQAYASVALAWGAVEPAPGRWDFSASDAAIASAGEPIVVVLFPGQFRGGAPPDAADSFRPVLGPRARAYVQQTVQRYSDRVDVWRIGEAWTLEGPDPATTGRMGPKGLSADQLSEFIGAVAAEVRAHDADARIIGPRLPGTLRSTIATELEQLGPEHWAETGDAGAMVRSRVSAWLIDHSPLFWDIPDGQAGRATRSAVGLLQTHLAGAVAIERIPNLAYEQYGYRFTRADGATRWVYWGEGEVALSDPWPKASTSVVADERGQHAWRGVGDTLNLSAVPVLLRN